MQTDKKQEARGTRTLRHQQEEPANVSEDLPGREKEGAPRGVLEVAKKVFRGGGSEPVGRMLQKGQLG